MLDAARQRQEAIFALHLEGLSIRDIASRIRVSPAVVQTAVKSALLRRASLHRREDRVPYELHVEVSRKLRSDENRVREIGLRNLDRMQKRERNPVAQRWLDDWRTLLTGPVETLANRMLVDDPDVIEMRQMSPFAGALSDAERQAAIGRASRFASE